jgi:hypothetical protein
MVGQNVDLHPMKLSGQINNKMPVHLETISLPSKVGYFTLGRFTRFVTHYFAVQQSILFPKSVTS